MAKIDRDVIEAAQASERKHGIPASVSLAQFALESAWGKKMPPDSHNPFGIKAVQGQPAVTVRTREVDRAGIAVDEECRHRTLTSARTAAPAASSTVRR